MDKLITFAIPCYNSADYMDTCIESILTGAQTAADIEIIIVDDGSYKDDTAAKADAWQERYPGHIRAIHQENGGHGAAVLTGLAHAQGIYFKVVDSDDWLDQASLAQMLDCMRELERQGCGVDLFITNYVYEHTLDGTKNIVDYRSVLPQSRVFSWSDIGHFHITQNLLMHALCYRSEILKNGDMPLPSHTFYVDNIYAYVPLPRCSTLYYLDTDLYRYFIGREDQSINEQIMANRIDQQVCITRIMMKSYHLYDEVRPVELRSYMVNYFIIMMAICSVFSRLSDHENAHDELKRLWDDLYAWDKRMWRRARLGVLGLMSNLPGEVGKHITLAGYRLAQKLVKFN